MWQRLGELEGPTVFPALGISFLAGIPLFVLGLSLIWIVGLVLAGWYALLGWALLRHEIPWAMPSPVDASPPRSRRTRRSEEVSPYRQLAGSPKDEGAQEARVLARFQCWAEQLPMAPLDVQGLVRRIERRSQEVTQLTTTIQNRITKLVRTVVQIQPRSFDVTGLLEEAERVCEVHRERVLETGDVPEASLEEWKRAGRTLTLKPAEQIVEQTFLQLELPVVDVTYGFGKARHQVSFLGRSLQTPSRHEERLLTRRAKQLRWWGGALAMIPPALLVFCGLRDGLFLRDQAALLLAASALFSLLGFATLWRWSLQRPVRGWIATLLIFVALAGAAAAGIDPATETTRAVPMSSRVAS